MKTTLIQIVRAHRLAAAHGHAWASVVYIPTAEHPQGEDDIHVDDLVGIPLADAAARIDERARGLSPHWPGITAPTWDEDGDIIHTTGTGRLFWLVQADGTTTISVRRPGEVEACSAAIDPHGWVTRVDYDLGRCLIRHAEVLAEALSTVAELDLADLKETALTRLYEAAIASSKYDVSLAAERLTQDGQRFAFLYMELLNVTGEGLEDHNITEELTAWILALAQALPDP